jgi:thiamine transport system permease protein
VSRVGARLGVAGLAIVPLVVLAVFFVLPIAAMLSRGFWQDGSFDPTGVLQVLGRPRVQRVLWFTLWSAALATVLTVVLGVPTTYVLYRLRFPGRGVLRALVMMPFVLPTVVVGVAFRTLLVRSGPLGFLRLDGTAAAIVGAMVFFNLAVVVRTVGASWESLDRRPAEAAAALGATPVQVLRSVTLPALRPAIISAATVVFLFCSTAFGVVLILGGLRYATVETEIYLLTTQFLDLRAAAALSILQLLAVVALLVLAHRARASRGGSSPARDRAPQRPRRGDLPALLVTTTVLGFVAAPIVALVVRSLRVAVDATLLAVVLGVAVAVIVSRVPRGRFERRGLALLDGAFMLPLGVSAVTLGFGFLIALDQPPLDLRSSPVLVPIAQAMVALPLVVRTIAPVLRSIDDRQRQAAATLGASPWRVACTIDAPIGLRPLLAATGFAFAISLGEFGATSFLARPDRPTLPVVIYRLISSPGQENFGMALAGSVVLAGVTVAVMSVVERLRVGSMGAF